MKRTTAVVTLATFAACLICVDSARADKRSRVAPTTVSGGRPPKIEVVRKMDVVRRKESLAGVAGLQAALNRTRTVVAVVYEACNGWCVGFSISSFTMKASEWKDYLDDHGIPLVAWTEHPGVVSGKWVVRGPYDPSARGGPPQLASGISISGGQPIFDLDVPSSFLPLDVPPTGLIYRVTVQPLNASEQPVGLPSSPLEILYKP